MNYKKDLKMIYEIYKITNKLNGKYYIGFHKRHDKEKLYDYMGSGKLIKRAIEKYGKENFEKEILFEYDNEHDAINKERELVDVSFVMNENTYNLSIGGNVCILYGKHNPMYGKRLSDEAEKRKVESFRKTISNRGYLHKTIYECYYDGKLFTSLDKLKEYDKVINRKNISKYVYENKIVFLNQNFNENMKLLYAKQCDKRKQTKAKQSILAKERFTGVKKTDGHKRKISESHKNKKCPWNQIINKNPEKIRKTAEKHRGMKRSKETCEIISKKINELYLTGKLVSGTKGKIAYHNLSLNKTKFFNVNDVIPEGWIKGMLPRKNNANNIEKH